MDFLSRLFDPTGFPARWNCGLWTAEHGWLHIASDIATWAAYMAIPIALGLFVWRRRDIPFPRIFWLFGAFIFACGTGHLIEAVMFWHPIYRFSGLLKVITAVTSWATVIVLVPVIPQALKLPGLAKLNTELEEKIRQRQEMERALRERAEELKAVNDDLERFNRLAVGREDRMQDLKQEINGLLQRLGEEPRYHTSAA